MHVLADICVWYLTSIYATATSKEIITTFEVSSNLLTLCQLAIAAGVGGTLVHVLNMEDCPSLHSSKRLNRHIWQLATVFGFGFVAQNLAFKSMDVELCMTLRAAEPLFSFAFSLLNKDAGARPILLLALLPIALGAAVSSIASASLTMQGFVAVMVANILFVYRINLAKSCMQEHCLGNLSLFYLVSRCGAVVQLATFTLTELPFHFQYELPGAPSLMRVSTLLALGLNGAAFFTYLQFSFIVASKVHPITHAVANAVRRPATILGAMLYFQDFSGASATKIGGICLACAGAALYSLLQLKIAMTNRDLTDADQKSPSLKGLQALPPGMERDILKVQTPQREASPRHSPQVHPHTNSMEAHLDTGDDICTLPASYKMV